MKRLQAPATARLMGKLPRVPTTLVDTHQLQAWKHATCKALVITLHEAIVSCCCQWQGVSCMSIIAPAEGVRFGHEQHSGIGERVCVHYVDATCVICLSRPLMGMCIMEHVRS